jgi:hypothetical protein
MDLEQKNSMVLRRDARERGIVGGFRTGPTSGFPTALPITSLLGMTIEFRSELQGHSTTNLQEN